MSELKLSVYVNSYDYDNENAGQWYDLSEWSREEFREDIQKYEEYMFSDFDTDHKVYDMLNEKAYNVDTLYDIWEMIEDLTAEQVEIVKELMEHTYEDLEWAVMIVEKQEYSIWENAEELGYEMMNSTYRLDEQVKCYIDFEKFGEDLMNDGNYFEMKNGKILELYR